MKKTRNRYHFQIRKCRKAAEMLKGKNLLNACITGEGDIFHLLNACITGEGDIFHELKILRGERYCAKTIDGINDNITGHFANVYERIYNSIDDKEEMAKIYSRVNNSLDSNSLKDVDLITAEKIREATLNLKSV